MNITLNDLAGLVVVLFFLVVALAVLVFLLVSMLEKTNKELRSHLREHKLVEVKADLVNTVRSQVVDEITSYFNQEDHS